MKLLSKKVRLSRLWQIFPIFTVNFRYISTRVVFRTELKYVNNVAAVTQESDSIAEDSGTEAGSVVEGQFDLVYIYL